MSDLFGDDFTAELKDYFINQLHDEIKKYIAAVDEASVHIFCKEISDKAQEWVVDARTNEFSFFAGWLDTVTKNLMALTKVEDFKKSLQQVCEYLDFLGKEKKDSPDKVKSFYLKSSNDHVSKYLHFQIANRDYALLARYVVEVMGERMISILPQPIAGLCGMMPYRGEAIPVFQLEEPPPGSSFYCIVCCVDKDIFSLKVSQVSTLLELADSALQSKEVAENFLTVPYVSHFALHKNKSLMIFDLPKLVAA